MGREEGLACHRPYYGWNLGLKHQCTFHCVDSTTRMLPLDTFCPQ